MARSRKAKTATKARDLRRRIKAKEAVDGKTESLIEVVINPDGSHQITSNPADLERSEKLGRLNPPGAPDPEVLRKGMVENLVLIKKRDDIAKAMASLILEPVVDALANIVTAHMAANFANMRLGPWCTKLPGLLSELEEVWEEIAEAQKQGKFDLPLAPKFKGRRPSFRSARCHK